MSATNNSSTHTSSDSAADNLTYKCLFCRYDFDPKSPQVLHLGFNGPPPDSGPNLEPPKLCKACCVLIFERAMEFEDACPATLVNFKLDPSLASKLVSPAFAAAYEARVDMVATLPANRVYCACKTYAGPNMGVKHVKKCPSAACDNTVCMFCAQVFADGVQTAEHEAFLDDCEKHIREREAEQSRQTDPFKDLTRGKEYQLCPECSRPVELAEECNHMSCPAPCKAQFCYVCGKKAAGDSYHWGDPPLCPRYGHPDDPPEETESLDVLPEVPTDMSLDRPWRIEPQDFARMPWNDRYQVLENLARAHSAVTSDSGIWNDEEDTWELSGEELTEHQTMVRRLVARALSNRVAEFDRLHGGVR